MWKHKQSKDGLRLTTSDEHKRAAAANNAQVEGAAFTAGTLSATTMRQNNTQIMSKVFEVSATADAVKTYGRAKETALTLVA